MKKHQVKMKVIKIKTKKVNLKKKKINLKMKKVMMKKEKAKMKTEKMKQKMIKAKKVNIKVKLNISQVMDLLMLAKKSKNVHHMMQPVILIANMKVIAKDHPTIEIMKKDKNFLHMKIKMNIQAARLLINF